MDKNRALWHIFETTGAVCDYLNYSKEANSSCEKKEDKKKKDKKEESGIGLGGN